MADGKRSPKQEALIREFLVDLNATQAAIRAGYSPRTAHVQGPRLLAKVSMRDEVNRRLRARARRSEVTADRIVAEYRKIAFGDVTEFVSIQDGKVIVQNTDSMEPDQTAALSEIAETAKGVRVKMHSKTAALDALAKHLGMFTENINVHNTGPPPVIQLIPVSPPAKRDE